MQAAMYTCISEIEAGDSWEKASGIVIPGTVVKGEVMTEVMDSVCGILSNTSGDHQILSPSAPLLTTSSLG